MAIFSTAISGNQIDNGGTTVLCAQRPNFCDTNGLLGSLSAFANASNRLTKTLNSNTGYEFTGGFTDRASGASYTAEMAASGVWMRFGFDTTSQTTYDVPYWTTPAPLPTADVGIFGGAYLPPGVHNVFDFDFYASSYSDAGTVEGSPYSAASGSFVFTDLEPGSLVEIRFDYNVLVQIGNTTVETALIWQTRDANGTPTQTFPLTTQPVFFGSDTVGSTYLNRQVISAYIASDEDVNARALLAVRANNLIQITPLTTLCIVTK